MNYGFEDIARRSDRVSAFLHGPSEVSLHWHGQMELIMVVAGAIEITLDGRTSTLRRGDLLIVNAGDLHTTRSIADETIVCGIHIDGNHFERLGLEGFASRRYLCKSFLAAKYYDRKVIQPIRVIIARLALAGHDLAAEKVFRMSLISMLCYHIHNCIPFETIEEGHCPREGGLAIRNRIRRIITRLENSDNLNDNLQGFADVEGLSISHLSRQFRLVTKMGFKEYVHHLRMDRTTAALLSSTAAITNIAQDVGYSNGQMFYRLFKARFGCTPAEFRKRHGGAGFSEVGFSIDGALPYLTGLSDGLPEALRLIACLSDHRLALGLSTPHNLLQPSAQSHDKATQRKI